jgi:hypothetical protein
MCNTEDVKSIQLGVAEVTSLIRACEITPLSESGAAEIAGRLIAQLKDRGLIRSTIDSIEGPSDHILLYHDQMVPGILEIQSLDERNNRLLRRAHTAYEQARGPWQKWHALMSFPLQIRFLWARFQSLFSRERPGQFRYGSHSGFAALSAARSVLIAALMVVVAMSAGYVWRYSRAVSTEAQLASSLHIINASGLQPYERRLLLDLINHREFAAMLLTEALQSGDEYPAGIARAAPWLTAAAWGLDGKLDTNLANALRSVPADYSELAAQTCIAGPPDDESCRLLRERLFSVVVTTADPVPIQFASRGLRQLVLYASDAAEATQWAEILSVRVGNESDVVTLSAHLELLEALAAKGAPAATVTAALTRALNLLESGRVSFGWKAATALAGLGSFVTDESVVQRVTAGFIGQISASFPGNKQDALSLFVALVGFCDSRCAGRLNLSPAFRKVLGNANFGDVSDLYLIERLIDLDERAEEVDLAIDSLITLVVTEPPGSRLQQLSEVLSHAIKRGNARNASTWERRLSGRIVVEQDPGALRSLSAVIRSLQEAAPAAVLGSSMAAKLSRQIHSETDVERLARQVDALLALVGHGATPEELDSVLSVVIFHMSGSARDRTVLGSRLAALVESRPLTVDVSEAIDEVAEDLHAKSAIQEARPILDSLVRLIQAGRPQTEHPLAMQAILERIEDPLESADVAEFGSALAVLAEASHSVARVEQTSDLLMSAARATPDAALAAITAAQVIKLPNERSYRVTRQMIAALGTLQPSVVNAFERTFNEEYLFGGLDPVVSIGAPEIASHLQHLPVEVLLTAAKSFGGASFQGRRILTQALALEVGMAPTAGFWQVLGVVERRYPREFERARRQWQ